MIGQQLYVFEGHTSWPLHSHRTGASFLALVTKQSVSGMQRPETPE
jgi:hypothetical protein